MITALFFGGINSSAFSYAILVVLAAGLVLGWRSAIIFTALSIIAGLVLVYLEANNLLPASLEYVKDIDARFVLVKLNM